MSPVYSAVFFSLALAWPALAPAAAGSGLGYEQGIARHPKSAQARQLPRLGAVARVLVRGPRSMAFSVQRTGAARVAGEAAWVFRLTLDGWLGLVASTEAARSAAADAPLSSCRTGH